MSQLSHFQKRFVKLGGGIGFLLAGALSGCAPDNPPKTGVDVLSTLPQEAPIPQEAELKPKVDILFVIDNSASMIEHQERLKKNIDRFVEAFERYDSLDFHIGAVSIFDSRRFGPIIKDFYPIGQLRSLRDPVHPGEKIDGPSFVTRVPGYKDILGETLKIGTQDLLHGGPEFEEIYSPIVAALDGRNADFLRADAHLAVIMMTDANDDSAISNAQLRDYLWNLKGQNTDKYSTYAALALDGCKQDPTSGYPQKIVDLVESTGGKYFNLCDENYGDRLAEAGRLIQKKASRVKIDLKARPELDTLKVRYNGEDLQQDPVKGWTYDPEKVAIIVSGDAELKSAPGAKIEIEFVPIDPRRVQAGRAKSKGL